jgi:hypothetical protein
LTVGNLDVNIFKGGSLDIDILTVGNLDGEQLAIYRVDERTRYRNFSTGASSTPIRRTLAHPALLGGPVRLAAVVFQLPLGKLFQDLETMSWVTDLESYPFLRKFVSLV